MYDFYKKYFLINLADYPNINIDFPITAFLSCFVLALIVTTIVVNYKRSKIEKLIKQLTRLGATTEDTAKTLDELNLENNVFKKLLESRAGQLSAMIGIAGETKITYEEYIEKKKEKGYKPEKIDFEEAKFYIKSDGADRAKRVLELGSASILNTVLFCLLIVAIYICLALLMPGILSLINDMLGNI